jgi:valyl-tRNA synthetase
MEQLIALVTGIRTIRATYEVEPRRPIDVSVAAPRGLDLLERHRALIQSLGRIHKLELLGEVKKAPRTIVQQVGSFEIHIPMAGLFDLAAEKGRLTKERAKVVAELESLRGRLSNPQFVTRARPEVVAECRQREVDLLAREARIGATLHDLGAEAAE